MVAKNLLSLLLLFLSIQSFAQSKFELGVEGGITNDKYIIKDPLNNLRTVPCIDGGGGGISFRLNRNENWFYEAALLVRESCFGYKFEDESGYGTTNSDILLHLPLRAGYYFKLSGKVNLSPVIGVAPSYRIFFEDASGELYYFTSSLSVHSIYTQRKPGNDFLILFQGGLSLDFTILKNIRLSLNPTYYLGTSNINTYDVNYTINNSSGTATSKATIDNNGSFTLQYQFKIYVRSKEITI